MYGQLGRDKPVQCVLYSIVGARALQVAHYIQTLNAMVHNSLLIVLEILLDLICFYLTHFYRSNTIILLPKIKARTNIT